MGTTRREFNKTFLGPTTTSAVGLENNWIPTSGRGFFLFFRFDGPQKAVFDKSFELPDVEKVG
jgi:hypothetical protein